MERELSCVCRCNKKGGRPISRRRIAVQIRKLVIGLTIFFAICPSQRIASGDAASHNTTSQRYEQIGDDIARGQFSLITH